MVMMIVIWQAIVIDEHNKQHLLQVNNHHFWEQSGLSFFHAATSITSKKLHWAWWQQNLTLQPLQHHGDPSNCNQPEQCTAPFASRRPCHFWEQSHRFHVLHMSNHSHRFLCQQCQQQCEMGGLLYFYAATSIFSCFWSATHGCGPLAKVVVCMLAVLYFVLAKLAKNANVCKNRTLGQIHGDPYDPRCTVVLTGFQV